MIVTLETALEENVMPVELAKGFFGNLSGLSQSLQNANPQSASPLANQLRKMLNGPYKGKLADLINSTRSHRLEAWPADFTTIPDSTLPKLVAGLAAVLDAAQLLFVGKASAEPMQREIRKCAQDAVAWFDAAIQTREPKREWIVPREHERSHDWRFGLLTTNRFTDVISGSSAGFYTMYDLLERLTPASDLGGSAKPVWRESSTPVLGVEAGGKGSVIMILTVSLAKSDADCFLPDLRFSGLTELRGFSDPDECLLESMRRCWEASKLKGAYRGYWRLEHRPVGEMPSDTMIAIPHFYGRSLEAAVMCCLRSAAGNAYDEDLPSDAYDREKLMEVDPLQTDVAITAQLGSFTADTPLKDIPLKAISGVPQKMSAARANRIQSVVFAPDQLSGNRRKDLSVEDHEELKAFEDASTAGRFSTGLQFSNAANLGAALDALLVRSRWLKAWQKATRINWLSRWEDGTARAPNDTAPGPDNDNPPAKPDADGKGTANSSEDE